MIITVAIDSYNEANGGTIATMRIVEGLKEKGHEVRILSAVNRDPSDPYFYKIPGFVLPGAEGAQESMVFLFGKYDKKTFEKAIRGADVVMVQFPFLMAKGVVKTAKRLGVPVVGSFHVQPQNIMVALGKTSKLLEKIIWLAFKHFLFKRVDTIISPSRFAAGLLDSQGVKARHKVISNGIPAEYVPGDHTRPGWFGDRMVLISVGRHAGEKRQRLLIEGVKRSKYKEHIQLILAGKGEDTEELRVLGSTLPVKPYIEYISDEDKLRFLNTADMYVHGSIVELESLSTAEAVGCGLPCLISDSRHSAASQFALDERFIFRSDDPDDMASRIDYWYEHLEELRSAEMRKKILAMAEKYRFERTINEYDTFLAEVAGKGIAQESRETPVDEKVPESRRA
jgi:glycosyltransferase involved in cell wall biosynthesis